jgi:serine/threonine protein kinase
MENELKEQKEKFGNNLIAWVKMQREAFNKNIESNYIYIRMHSNHQQILHNLIRKFSGSFATIECQLLAAMELSKRNAIVPILGEELGRGGFYSVYAVHWGSEDNLAVKKLLDPTAEYVRMAALEAHYHRAVTLLQSDYIAPLRYIYENNINDNQKEFWLIMPRYPKSLRQYLMQHIHEIEFARVVSFALIIATTLADLHRIEIVHRDLKTSNIMLDENEQCYIIDFGTARFGLSNTTIVGTAPLPPEIVEAYLKNGTGFPNYDGTAADIYSFGLILYEMLPKRSYERLDTESLSRLEELLASYTQLDANMRTYGDQIRACLNRNPSQRPSAIKLVENLKLIQQRTEIKPCMICDDKDRGIRFVPCGHKITCAQCWQSWSTSPNGNRQCILCKAIVTNHTVDDSNATFFLQQ